MDECATGSPVAVSKGMNGLELTVCQCRLKQRRMIVTTQVGRKVDKKFWNAVRGRRNEGGRPGVRATNPVLFVSNHTCPCALPRTLQERRVDLADGVDRDGCVGIHCDGQRAIDRTDVPENRSGHVIGGIPAFADRRLLTRQSPHVDLKSFNVGAGHRLRSQEEAREGLEVDGWSRGGIQGTDLRLDIHEISSYRRGKGQVLPDE